MNTLSPEQQGLADGLNVRFVLPRRALHGANGERLGPSIGESLEFQDYRDYTPGDDLRNLDWLVLARTDREVIRVRQEEIAPVIEIFRDRSASMNVPPAKNAVADYLFGLFTASAPACRVIERDAPVTPRAVRILVSDLLTPEDPVLQLTRLAHRAAALFVVRVLSPEERSPAPGGAFECIDSETGEHRELIFNDSTLAAYHTAFAAHTARWHSAARQHAATFVELTSNAPFSEHISALARARMLEGRK